MLKSNMKDKIIAIRLNEEEQQLLKEIDEFIKNSYVYKNRSHFTKVAWIYFLKHLK